MQPLSSDLARTVLKHWMRDVLVLFLESNILLGLL